MSYKFDLGSAIAVPAAMAAAVFAPQTLLFAGGMYALGALSGSFMGDAISDAEDVRLEGLGRDRPAPGDHAKEAARCGESFVTEFSAFCPVLPLAAWAVGTFMRGRADEARSELRKRKPERENRKHRWEAPKDDSFIDADDDSDDFCD